jgi:hypothetical protein
MPCDLFISYARRDNRDGRVSDLVRRISTDFDRFAGRPLTCFFDLNDIHGMDDWRQRILGGLRESHLMLACLSPAYIESPNCAWEFNEYRKHELREAVVGEGVAPIYFVEIPGWDSSAFERHAEEWVAEFRRRQQFDLRPWFMEGDEALRDKVVREQLAQLNEQIARRLDRGLRARSSPGNVEAHDPHFVGRRSELRRLREAVGLGVVGILTAIRGLGGVGKTALATEYAHAFAHEYGGGRWLVRCEGKDDVREALTGLAPALGLDMPEHLHPQAAFERVLAELHERAKAATPPRCLVILDNVDRESLLEPRQLRALPAAEWLHVIATTRLQESALAGVEQDRTVLTVNELPEDDAVALIESYLPRETFADPAERSAAREIARWVGCMTLAVEAAATHIGRYYRSGASCVSYLAQLQTAKARAPSLPAYAEAQTSKQAEQVLGASIASTLARLGDAELAAVQYAALLPADEIELAWIRALIARRFPAYGDDAPPGIADPWSDLLSQLYGLRLLQSGSRRLMPQTPGGPIAKMHRVMQAAITSLVTSDELELRRADLADLLGGEAARLDTDISRESLNRTWRFNARELDLQQRRQLVGFLRGEHTRWHPQKAEHVKNLGAYEDYAEVWRFPCCDKTVASGDDAPSQYRDDGCEQAPVP